jgi:hypothetical protein
VLWPEKTWKSHLDESTSAGEKVFAVILQLLSFRIISGDYRVEEKFSLPFSDCVIRPIAAPWQSACVLGPDQSTFIMRH